jgi:uncharacterized protein
LSAGYTCNLEFADGTTPEGEAYDAIQRNIRINHLAIVAHARGGSTLRIGDGADHWGVSPFTVADKEGGVMPDNLRTMIVDGLSVEVTDAAAMAIEKLQGQVKALTDAKAKMEAEYEKDKDEAEKEMAAKDAAIADLKKSQLSDADLDARVAARADLLAKAKAIAPTVKTDGLSDAAIRKAVVVAAVGDAAIAGKGEAYIDARFDILADAKPADPLARPLPAQTIADRDVAHSAFVDGFAAAHPTMKGVN